MLSSIRNVVPVSLVLALLVLSATPAYALNDATASNSFANVGTFNGVYGTLIADNWVLTASHVTPNTGVTFSSGYGSSLIDATFLAPGASFPGNDLTLLHLGTSIQSNDLPTLNANLLTNQTAHNLAVTLANASHYVDSTLVSTQTVLNDNGVDYTVNYVVVNQDGSNAYLQSGDSGSALFSGNVTNSSGLLLGVASSICGNTFSCYTQVAAYRDWMDSTLAGYGNSAKWNVASVVPEPDVFNELLVGGSIIALLALRKRTQTSSLA